MSHILDRPVEHSNMQPSLRAPNSAAFPLAMKQKQNFKKAQEIVCNNSQNKPNSNMTQEQAC